MASRNVIEADENDLLVSFVDLNPEPEDFLSAVIEGLSADQKSSPASFFTTNADRSCSIRYAI